MIRNLYINHARYKLASIIFIVVFLIYIPLFFSVYGYVDDYTFISSGGFGILQAIVDGGRPISGILAPIFHAIYNSKNSVNDLSFVRLIGIFGACMFAESIYFVARKYKLSEAMSAFFAVAAVSLPAMQIYTSWSVMCLSSWACVAAIIGSYVIWTYPNSVSSYFATIFLLLASLLTYQPSAMVFFALIPLHLYQKYLNGKSISIKSFLPPAITSIIALALAYLFIKASPYIFYSGVPFPRASLTTNIAEKVNWFISQPLPHSLSLYVVPYIKHHYFLFAIYIVMLLFSSTLFKKAWWRFVVVSLLVIPLSYLPNLLVVGDWASNRTLIGLDLFALVVIVLFSVRLDSIGYLEEPMILGRCARLSRYISMRCERTFSRMTGFSRYSISKTRVGTIFLLVIAACGALSAEKDIIQEYILPNSFEWAYVLNSVRSIKNAGDVCVIRSSWTDSIAKFVSYDDFGSPAGSPTWSAKSIVEDAYYQVHGKHIHVRIVKTKKHCKNVIDMGNIKNFRIFVRSSGW